MLQEIRSAIHLTIRELNYGSIFSLALNPLILKYRDQRSINIDCPLSIRDVEKQEVDNGKINTMFIVLVSLRSLVYLQE